MMMTMMITIQITEITSYLLKAHNWKSPGHDKIQNYATGFS